MTNDLTAIETDQLTRVQGGGKIGKVKQLADDIWGWLGKGSRQQDTPKGARQFISPDNDRVIRFDLEPGQHKGAGPHINLENRSDPVNPNRHIFLK